MFAIKSIEIYPECRYRKNLEVGIYPMEDALLRDFFGENILLHTIVGKNGSGKSSLLDIVFRMMNNVGAVMCKKEKREASERVCYARHIYADLNYEKSWPNEESEKDEEGNPKIHICKLCIRDTALWLEYDANLYWLSDPLLMNFSQCARSHYDQQKREYGEDHFMDYSDMHTLERKRHLAQMTFYTVATNYSMLGFQSSDYDEEDSLEWSEEIFVIDGKSGAFVTCDGKFVMDEGWVKRKNWLKGIFHKNDGYMCPIVLNPFRDGGKINMDTEAALTVSRLSALLVSERMDKHPLIEDYCLDYISYQRNKEFYLRFEPRYSKKDKDLPEKKNLLADGGDLKLFRKAGTAQGTVSWTILNKLEKLVTKNLSDTEVYVRLYVVYKILNIAGTYPFYEKFSSLGDINAVFSLSKVTEEQEKLLDQLVHVIDIRKTHIEQKVHQALNFIDRLDSKREKDSKYDASWLEGEFNYGQYQMELGLPMQYTRIETCLEDLPPNLFWQTIYMKRVDKEGRVIESGIPFKRMSSGQKQMLYQLSTLIYHLMNLKSVTRQQVKYYHVSIVLDEIEVCFHPEYQRQFLSRMLELLCDRLHLNKRFGIHIWLTTHSPFILSDIPNELITYMENGHRLTEEELAARKIRKPMAANISELLHQSFFLHDGFIGEYARKKILSLVEFLKTGISGDDKWTREQAEIFIDGINEPFISKQLRMLYHKQYEKNTH